MAQFTVYSSGDASAPTLSGTADSLCALLNACLVDGYGAKAAAGWTRAYDDANKSVFKQAASGDSAIQACLRVLDDASGAGGAKEAICTGYESMSDVDTGTNAIGTWYWRKSVSANATARDWILIADGRTFYLCNLSGDAATLAYRRTYYFGDFYSYATADLYRVIHGGGTTANSGGYLLAMYGGLATAAGGGKAIARNYLATVGSYTPNLFTNASMAVNSTYLGGVMLRPNASDGSLIITPWYITDNTTHASPLVHGHLRGLYWMAHEPATLNEGDTFSGTGLYAGRSFTVIYGSASATTTAFLRLMCYETSDTVDTN